MDFLTLNEKRAMQGYEPTTGGDVTVYNGVVIKDGKALIPNTVSDPEKRNDTQGEGKKGGNFYY